MVGLSISHIDVISGEYDALMDEYDVFEQKSKHEINVLSPFQIAALCEIRRTSNPQ